ncbi:MAG: FG-GAP repeat protein, partial [Patescibacteria group bacterium]
EYWQCGEWAACTNIQQARTCTDTNSCGTVADRPPLSQACQASSTCTEDWACGAWSACTGGSMVRTCGDRSACGTVTNKPAEQFVCSGGQVPGSDTVAPNSVITSAPAARQPLNQAAATWTGVDDQTGANQLQYSYQLDSRSWSSWSTATRKTFYRLRNGPHTIRVKSRDVAGNEDPTPAVVSFTITTPYTIVAAPRQSGPQVRLLDTAGKLLGQFFAYEQTFRGGVVVASGDGGGDGREELIVAPGPGRAADVRIFRRNSSLITSFLAYPRPFSGGVSVAAADVNGDGSDEIVTAPQGGGGPNVRVFGFRGTGYAPIYPGFMAYDTRFRGGVSVTRCDIEGDGTDEIVTGTLSGGNQVKVFGLRNGSFRLLTPAFAAFHPLFRGGVTVACGDVNADGSDEIVVGVAGDSAPLVRVYGRTPQGKISLQSSFTAFNPSFRGGVSVATLYTGSDPAAKIVVAVRSNSESVVRYFNASGTQVIRQIIAWPKSYLRGIDISTIH